MSGGEAMLRAVLANGVDTVFGLPGVQTYPLYDALKRHENQVRSVHARHELSAAYMAYGEALEKAGAFVATDRLGPSASATTLTMADGKPQVIDGPFADSKEQIGGYYIIDVPDLDAALEWAGRCPAAHHGKIEIRPVWAM